MQCSVLEVGCGVGNSTFPLLATNPNLRFHSFDFSATAVQILTEHAEYDASKIVAFTWDPATQDIPDELNNPPGMYQCASVCVVALQQRLINHALLQMVGLIMR
jgi:SAM-dependent methyltransferase